MKKADIVNVLNEEKVPLPDALPTKLILLGMVKKLNLKKEYVIDEMANEAGYEVLRLPPYHSNFNPIEMVWANIKDFCRKNNIR